MFVQIYDNYLSYRSIRTKKARTKLCVSVFEVFDYLAPNIRVKPTPSVSVIALFLVPSESVEVSKTRIKVNAFPIYLKCAYLIIRYVSQASRFLVINTTKVHQGNLNSNINMEFFKDYSLRLQLLCAFTKNEVEFLLNIIFFHLGSAYSNYKL